MPHLEITEVILVYFNIVHQQESRVLYTFVPNRPFGQLLDISPKTFSEKKSSEFSYIEVWFTEQNSKLLDKEDKISITLVVN